MSELNLPQIAESQSLAYITSNDADARLESALCDSLGSSVPESGGVTLTSEQFQTAWHHLLDGTPTGPFDLVIPAVRRPFMVTNLSGQTATVKTGAGASAPVLDTETRLLYCDGTDVTALSDSTSTGGGTGSFSGALVLMSADQTIASGSNVLIDWGAESYDTGDYYDSSGETARFTVPAGVSQVLLRCQLRWDSNASGTREILAYKNGSSDFDGRPFAHTEAQSGRTMQLLVSPVLAVSPGDYFEIYAAQTSGSNRTVESHVSCWFSIQAVG